RHPVHRDGPAEGLVVGQEPAQRVAVPVDDQRRRGGGGERSRGGAERGRRTRDGQGRREPGRGGRAADFTTLCLGETVLPNTSGSYIASTRVAGTVYAPGVVACTRYENSCVPAVR